VKNRKRKPKDPLEKRPKKVVYDASYTANMPRIRLFFPQESVERMNIKPVDPKDVNICI
jgi:hypothetical protein